MKPLVIAAHSGHELLLWKWLRNERPDFVVLTNGAGSTGVPRLEPTVDNLARAGARWIPEVVQPVADADIYRALLEGEIPSPIRAVGDEPEVPPLVQVAPGHFVARHAIGGAF